jgi:type I restriction enzyme S subunit
MNQAKSNQINVISKKLDEACVIEFGTRVVQKKDGGNIYPVYGGGGATFKMDTYNRENCVVVSRFAMSKQCTRFVEGKFYLNDSGLTVRPKNEKELAQEYLNYLLLSLNDTIYSLSRGTAQRNLNVSKFRNLEIRYPDSIELQLHIANVLSKAENLIAQRKESIRLLDEFLKSTFLEMFGDLKGEKVPLSTACIVNPKKSEINSMDKSIDVSFVPMAFVSENGEIDLSQTRKLGTVWNGFTYFRENDVVFAKITPCMENGKGAIMRNLKNKIGFGSTEFHVLRPIKDVSTAEWIYHLTMQHSFRKKAEQNMSGSAGQKRVPTDYFDKVRVVIPPIELQTQFARIVEKTEALKTQYQHSLTELENLYGSLSQKAFKGELTSIKNHVHA